MKEKKEQTESERNFKLKVLWKENQMLYETMNFINDKRVKLKGEKTNDFLKKEVNRLWDIICKNGERIEDLKK